MKTKTLFACLGAGLLTLAPPVRAADNSAIAKSHTATFEHRNHARQAHRAPVLSSRDVSGGIPRAIRGGNPLQMLNPRAPAMYGTAEENVVLDPDVPGRGDGIKLLSFSF